VLPPPFHFGGMGLPGFGDLCMDMEDDFMSNSLSFSNLHLALRERGTKSRSDRAVLHS
jgi:hypothetical protein